MFVIVRNFHGFPHTSIKLSFSFISPVYPIIKFCSCFPLLNYDLNCFLLVLTKSNVLVPKVDMQIIHHFTAKKCPRSLGRVWIVTSGVCVILRLTVKTLILFAFCTNYQLLNTIFLINICR